jgi:acetyltransferase-like isoleucine patch superfamily enzyme
MFKSGPRQVAFRPTILKYFTALLMTDDERAEYFGLPEGCRMRENAKIGSPENFKCGKYVWIGEDAKLDATGGLEIGDHTTISANVFVWSHSSYLANLAYSNQSGNSLIMRAPTKIGSGVYIGGPSVVYPGVTIGDRVVVLPMSVVTSDIPSGSMAAGSPARVIKKIDDAYIREKIKQFFPTTSDNEIDKLLSRKG